MSNTNRSPVAQQAYENAIQAGRTDSEAELMAELADLKAENLRLVSEKAAGVGKISLKVSEKGALSMYGMGRFPVTLYKGQWETIFAQRENVEKFIKEQGSKLKNKEDETEDERKARLERVAKYEAETKAKVAANNAKNAQANVG